MVGVSVSKETQDATTLKTLRTALKAVDPECRVSNRNCETGWFTVRVPYRVKEVRAALPGLGLVEMDHELEGTRWDWVTVLAVATVEAAAE